MNDEEIQRRVQQGVSLPGAEGKAYRRVFDALGKEPEFVLPPSFAEDVIRKIGATAERSHDMAWMMAGIAGCFIALIVALVLTNFQLDLGVLSFVKTYKGILLFGALFVLALHWLDRRVIRKSIY